jgi:hypothetical protein
MVSPFAFTVIVPSISDVVRSLDVLTQRPVFHENTDLTTRDRWTHAPHSLDDFMRLLISRLWRTNTGCSNDSLLGHSALIEVSWVARGEVLYLNAAAA